MIEKNITSGKIVKIGLDKISKSIKKNDVRPYVSIGLTVIPGEYKSLFIDAGTALVELLEIIDANSYINDSIKIINKTPILIYINEKDAKGEDILKEGDHVLIDFRREY